jgi:hypothetical protein
MLKKLFAIAAAAAALSVPLAGVAWADVPSDPSSNDNPVGAGGVPKKIGDGAASLGQNPSGDPITPGSVFSTVAKVPDSNAPDAYGALIDATVAPLLGAAPFGSTPPGVGIKTFTSGCSHGRHLTLDGSSGGESICS